MSGLSSSLHHVVGIIEAIALYSPVKIFHSSPDLQMESEMFCFGVQSAKWITSFVASKILSLSLLKSGPVSYCTEFKGLVPYIMAIQVV